MKRIIALLMLMAVLLLAAACGGGSEEGAEPAANAPTSAGQPAQDQPAQAAATNTPAPATATPVPPTATPEMEEEEITLSEEQLAALEKLDSYRLVVTYTSKGVDADGNPIDDSAEIITEYARATEARRMVMTFIDNTAPEAQPESIESYQIGQDMYVFGGDDVGWMRVSIEESPFSDPDLAMMTSGNIFSDLEQMRRVRPDERISGINSRHYQFDEKVLGKLFGEDMGNVKASGDVWVAKDGGYVTKYEMTIDVDGGSGGMFDPNMTSGTLEMSFELQDVNEDITIEMPEAALASASLAGFDGAFPMPEDASVQAASANFTILDSAMPVEEVVAFYEAALAELGWTKDEQGSMSMGDMASLSFTKDGAMLSLIVAIDEKTGKTQIMASTQ